MTFQLRITGPAKRDLARLPEKILPAVMEFMSGPLIDNPHRAGKPLEGQLKGLYAARRGTFRIVYRIVEDHIQVQVVRVRHRADAYRPN